MSFENVVSGKLRLKGAPLPAKGGIKKKKKKTAKSSGFDSLQLQALKDAEAALKEEEERGGQAGIHKGGGEDEEEEGNQEPVEDLRTPAERRYHEQLERLENGKAKKLAAKSHRQKVEEFNQYLANLSEHYDIPKVGPG